MIVLKADLNLNNSNGYMVEGEGFDPYIISF